MPRLRAINLYNNSFTGFIPPSFSNISTLETLIISRNQLQGNIPQQIGNLSNLKEFYGGANSFSGAIPSEIGKLRMLQYLSLGNNMLQGLIPQEIGNLYKLEILQLSNNSFSGSIPAGVFNISTLVYIYMVHNKLSGILPPTLGSRLPNLEVIFLYNNTLTGKIPESISNASKLNQIALQQNMFTGSIPTSLGNLRLLECLHLYSNNLTNDASHQELSFITSLTNCPHLEDLTVSGNPLDALIPPSIGNLSKTVKRFSLSGCKIKGRIPDEIGNLSSLVKLRLENNDLSGFLPTTIGGLRGLQGLFLHFNNIQGSLPITLCDMPEISIFYLSQNQISGPIPDCIGNVSSLRNIYLDSNTLNSTIPSSIWNLKDLLQLDLSSNSLTGNLPLGLHNLKVASLIDLSRNSFTGVIPDEYGSMLDLITFSLASNKLQGSIPRSLGKMIGLESLDLSNNNLSGEIPKSLEGLRSLNYFNVSFNKLRGEIPTGGNFKSFNYQSFASNEALCGDDPQLQVPLCGSTRTTTTKTMPRRRLILIVSAAVFGSLILATILVITWIMRRRRKEEPPQDSSGSRFSYTQIQRATNGFSKENLLGSGSFGSVYLARLEKGVVMAVKVFNLQMEYASKSFETECEMLSKLRHRNLTKVISACSNLDFKALLLEYMQNGSLDDWVHSDGSFLDLMQRLEIMIDVAAALEYLHHGFVKPVIHCDLKPSNILLDGNMVGHVTDFGITKLVGHEESVVHTQTLATLGYMAPEYGSEGVVSTACDVYSYGIVLMETFTRRRPSDHIFGGELSLRSWIKGVLPHSVSKVVDSNLMREEDESFAEKMECVASILELAMDCSVESAKDRMNMKNVSAALKKIKLALSTGNV